MKLAVSILHQDSTKSSLQVPKFIFLKAQPSLEEIEKEFDHKNIPFQPIPYHWPEHPTDVFAAFRIAYSKDEIFLQYKVQETRIRALEVDDETGMPWHDSCVEFFLIPGNDKKYYNFEFNCIGTSLLSSGESRHGRNRYKKEITRQIRRNSSMGTTPFDEKTGNFEWTFTAAIPISLFAEQNIKSLDGLTIPANFFKCGDKLSEPHWLTWSRVFTETPSFHEPEYFGVLYFEK